MNNSPDLETLADTLLLGGTLIESSGLLHGRIGIAVFFFHYARHTGEVLYEEYAEELIKSVLDDISLKTPVNYRNGLAGIGCAFEYFAQHGFLEIDTDEMLAEIDEAIFKAILTCNEKDADAGLYDGLTGLGRYCLFRLTKKSSNDDKFSTFSSKIIHLVELLKKQSNTDTDSVRFFEEVERLRICSVKLDTNSHIPKSSPNQLMEIQSILKSRNLGLYNGYAGIALSLLAQQDKNHKTWLQLL